MAHRGRVVCCGAAAQYDDMADDLIQPGPQGIPQHLINRSRRLEGFMTADFAADWNHALGQLGKWLSEGAINAAVHMWHGGTALKAHPMPCLPCWPARTSAKPSFASQGSQTDLLGVC